MKRLLKWADIHWIFATTVLVLMAIWISGAVAMFIHALNGQGAAVMVLANGLWVLSFGAILLAILAHPIIWATSKVRRLLVKAVTKGV